VSLKTLLWDDGSAYEGGREGMQFHIGAVCFAFHEMQGIAGCLHGCAAGMNCMYDACSGGGEGERWKEWGMSWTSEAWWV